MEYTDKEKAMLSLLEKTNFQHLSEEDLFAYASKLNELRPEVISQVVSQFPEFVSLLQSAVANQVEILNKVMESDDKSLEQVYASVNKEMDADAESRRQYFDLADKVREDLSKGLDNPSLSEEERENIREQEIEILHIVDKKDQDIRSSETEKINIVDKKDSEKREFNWKVLGVASTFAALAICVGASALSGKIDIKFPHKNK